MRRSRSSPCIAAFACITLWTTSVWAQQAALPEDLRTQIDRTVADVLATTGTPSASIAVVRDARVVYTQAYGLASIDPPRQASPAMRYSIGSISKQFTAAALLMLAEEGKLSLDDTVSRWFPSLTRAGDVTVRQLLSMTSGYQDYWPQDYVMPAMLDAVTPAAILEGWGRKPLDFGPGTAWQYSNTNYVIAGLIVERASGTSLIDLLQRRVFGPLHMTSIADSDVAPLPPSDPSRYLRYALGPARPAPKEGPGWMFGAGELAMTAQDLATWDISLIDQSILTPASYRAMETEVLLSNGVGARYGLGVSVGTVDGRRLISHGGEVSGFTAANNVYPDQRTAVVALTNLDATPASAQIAARIAALLFRSTDPDTERAVEQARRLFEGLQQGQIDRGQLTANASSYFTPQALSDFASSLGPLGPPRECSQETQTLRGGMVLRRFRIGLGGRALRLTTFTMPDGKLEQYQIAPM